MKKGYELRKISAGLEKKFKYLFKISIAVFNINLTFKEGAKE